MFSISSLPFIREHRLLEAKKARLHLVEAHFPVLYRHRSTDWQHVKQDENKV